MSYSFARRYLGKYIPEDTQAPGYLVGSLVDDNRARPVFLGLPRLYRRGVHGGLSELSAAGLVWPGSVQGR